MFTGPWETGHVARDGAVIGFCDVERAVKRFLGRDEAPGFKIVELAPSIFLADDLATRLQGLDIVLANCGPMAAFLFAVRAERNLRFSIIREVRTLGWIGYAFQEYVATALQRSGDVCTHVSRYSMEAWRGFRGDCADLFYYPMLRRERMARCAVRPRDRGLRCGYFSRLSRDKGLAHVPDIVAKLHESGWAVESVDFCGPCEDEGLYETVGGRLRALGVSVRHRGGLAYGDALAAMAEVDIILFPSVSSFEAAGRVIPEAYSRGKTVIATDFCASHDLVSPAFRIPLSFLEAAAGATDRPFEVARPAVEDWRVPAWEAENYVQETCEGYRASPASLRRVLQHSQSHALGLSAAAGGDASKGSVRVSPARACGERPLRMRFDWDRFDRLSPEAWCAGVREGLRSLVRDQADLRDLGGAMKRSLIEAGFTPRVVFQEG